jgi:hypothetical protein
VWLAGVGECGRTWEGGEAESGVERWFAEAMVCLELLATFHFGNMP